MQERHRQARFTTKRSAAAALIIHHHHHPTPSPPLPTTTTPTIPLRDSAPPRRHAMASDTSSVASQPPMTTTELVSFVKDVLEADEEHQAKVSAASPNDLPTGSTLDLSHKGISTLPVEVVVLIKDKVERYGPTTKEAANEADR